MKTPIETKTTCPTKLRHIKRAGIGHRGVAAGGLIQGVEFIIVTDKSANLAWLFAKLGMSPIDHSRTRDVAVLPLEAVTLK